MYEGTTYLTQKVLTTSHQGCQLAYFQTKNLKLGKFWRVFKNIDVNQFIDIWCILQRFGIFNGIIVFYGLLAHFPRLYYLVLLHVNTQSEEEGLSNKLLNIQAHLRLIYLDLAQRDNNQQILIQYCKY
jgi:hypothetical protein